MLSPLCPHESSLKFGNKAFWEVIIFVMYMVVTKKVEDWVQDRDNT